MMRHPPSQLSSLSGLGPRHIPISSSSGTASEDNGPTADDAISSLSAGLLDFTPHTQSRSRSLSCARDDIQQHYGRRLFQRLDADGDGIVTRHDFVTGLTTERVRAMEVTEVEANRLFDKIDSPEQGVLSEEQFMKVSSSCWKEIIMETYV